MKQFLRHIFLLLALFMATASAWAQKPVYKEVNGVGTWYSLYETGERTLSTIDSETLNAFTPVGTNLTFDAKRAATGLGNLKVAPIVNGQQQSDIFDQKPGKVTKKNFLGIESQVDYTDAPYSATVSNSNTNQIKFYTVTGATLNKYFKNVKLPLKKHILIADGSYGKTSESKSFGNVTIGNVSAAQTVKLRSFLTTDNITITSNNAAFRVCSSSNQGAHVFNVGANACASTNGASGTPASGSTLGDINLYDINIYFVPTSAGKQTGTITISDGTSSATISVSGVGMKKTQTLTWVSDFKDDMVSLPAGKEIISPATVNSGLPLTYTSSKEAILAVEGSTLKALKAGEVTLTVAQAGNDEWNPVSATKTIRVIEKTIQYIHWIDNLTRLKVGGEPVQLTATAEILLNAETDETIEAPERTALITYQSADENVVTINGSELIIVGEGTTTVTASLPGDDIYEATSISMPVRVRVPSTTCEAYVLDAPEEHKYAAATAGSYEPVEFNGPGHILTFQARSSNSTRVGPIIYEQYVNGEWKHLDNGNPDTDWRDYWYELDRNATKVRFRNELGSYERHFKNVLVTQATYLETTTPEITVEKSVVGDEIQRNLIVQYSNIPAGAIITNTSDDIMVSTDELDSDCGKYGEQIITIKTIPFEVGTMEDVVTIHEEVTGLTLNIPIKIHTQKAEQHLYWDVPTQPITSCSDLQLPISTTEGLAINWSVIEGGDCAELDVNGNLLIYATGEITLEATNEGNAIYAPFSQTYTIPVAYNPIFLGTEDNDWNNPNNWNVCHLPSETDVVTMQASAVLEGHVTVRGLIFNDGGSIEILSTGGLTVGASGIVGAIDGSITIDNTPQGAGFLKVDPTTDNKPAKVTVNYKTRTYDNGSPRNEVWQYLGMPGANAQISTLEGVSMYHWKETAGWIQKSAADLQNIPAWDGYAFTQSKEKNATFQISVEPIWDNKQIDFTCTPAGMKGDNLFVNSYLAPIDVTKIDENDIVDPDNKLTRTFFLFNSGSWNEWNAGAGDITASDYYQSSPGHYYSIPFYSAKFIDDGTTQVVIPSMQGVYVYAEGKAALKLDYNKHVLAGDAMNMHHPMRAPQHQMEADAFRRVRIQASSENSGADRMYIVQEKNTTPDYDNGYDGDNIIASGQVNIYTHEPFGQMEVSCSNHIDSMLIGFTAGEDSIYTLTFGAVVGEDMYLLDLQTDSLMHLSDGKQYSFAAQPNSVNDTRFRLVIIPTSSDSDQQPNEDNVTTDVDNMAATTRLWVNDNIVYVMEAPKNSTLSIYSVNGMCVYAKHTISYAPYTLNLSTLPTGVYVLRLNDQAYKFVCK